MELMKLAGIPAGAQAYTSLMHACIKEGSQDNIQYAFQVNPFSNCLIGRRAGG